MNSPYLPVFESNAALSLKEMLPLVVRGRADLPDVLDFCQLYRIKGICSLFLEGRPDHFRIDLHNSGRAFLHYLKVAEDADKITSRAAPFFDAAAAGDTIGAREIARTARPTWNRAEEYEEDFLYVFFLLKYFFLEGTPAECGELLARYEEVLAGADDVRLDLCRALLDKDAAGLDDAIDRFLIEQEERYLMLLSREVISPEVGATEGQLNVEGLALIRLAESIGIETQRNYLFIPWIARKDAPLAFVDDSWMTPE